MHFSKTRLAGSTIILMRTRYRTNRYLRVFQGSTVCAVCNNLLILTTQPDRPALESRFIESIDILRIRGS
jgi:hypothetical protein